MSIVTIATDHLASMPDIANTPHIKPQGALDWVGMSNIELPIMLAEGDQPVIRVGSRVQAYVSLDDAHAKGIHMSRLYLALDNFSAETALNLESIKQLLASFLESHNDLSQMAFVEFKFDYHLRRSSLLSGKSGWKSYPVMIRGSASSKGVHIELGVEVPYSSTCPCSAALARQLIQDNFASSFGEKGSVSTEKVIAWLGSEQGIIATPHSQRSIAQVKVVLDDTSLADFPITDLIDQLENRLQTPVQAAVKREDEQEFARLNGQNPMFCEDAARKIQAELNSHDRYLDFWVRVNHLESLHAHDAVSIVTKGVDNGYLPTP